MLTTLSKRRVGRLNARQCKKHHVGEYQELGFALNVAFKTELDQAGNYTYIDALIDTVEKLGLAYGGGDSGGFVSTDARGSVTIAQRDALLAWVRSYPAVAHAEASELLDAWYDTSWV